MRRDRRYRHAGRPNAERRPRSHLSAVVGVVLVAIGSLTASAAEGAPLRSCPSVELSDGTRIGVMVNGTACPDASEILAVVLNTGRASAGWRCESVGADMQPIVADCARRDEQVLGLAASRTGSSESPWWYAAIAALIGAVAAGGISLLVQRRHDESAVRLAREEREAGQAERERLARVASQLEVELARVEGASGAYRAQLPANDLGSLSELIADLLSTGAQILRVKSDESWQVRIERAKSLQADMKSLRHRLLYLDPALDEPLLQLGNMPQWAASYVRNREKFKNHSPAASERYLELANELRDAVYKGLRVMAIEGRQLSDEERAELTERTRALVEHWEATSRDSPGPVRG